MLLSNMGTVWAHRLSLAAVVCTFLLVTAGGLVTSNGAALSIPDWPLAWGRLIPPLEGGIRFEFAHRVLAAVTGVLTFALAMRLRRRLAWLAFGTVVLQAALGGALVKFVDPKTLAIVHASLAQLTFGLVVATCFKPRASLSPAATVAAAALFIQTVLGAAVRHEVIGPVPHFVWAGVTVIAVMFAGLQVLSRHMEDPALRRPAMLLLSFTFSQIFIGMGAYMGRVLNADAPQPLPLMVWFTVAHVAVGSLAFGAAVVLAMIVGGHARRAEDRVPHGGMLVA